MKTKEEKIKKVQSMINIIGSLLSAIYLVPYAGKITDYIINFIGFWIITTICSKSILFSLYTFLLFAGSRIIDISGMGSIDSLVTRASEMYSECFISITILISIALVHIILNLMLRNYRKKKDVQVSNTSTDNINNNYNSNNKYNTNDTSYNYTSNSTYNYTSNDSYYNDDYTETYYDYLYDYGSYNTDEYSYKSWNNKKKDNNKVEEQTILNRNFMDSGTLYNKDGSYAGNSYHNNYGGIDYYNSDGSYAGTSYSTGSGAEYYDNEGQYTGYCYYNEDTGEANYYDREGQYTGSSYTNGSETNYYDSMVCYTHTDYHD